MGKPNPCFTCTTDRHEACHASCKGYTDWKSERDRAKALMRLDQGYDEYQSIKAVKINKSHKDFKNRGGSIK